MFVIAAIIGCASSTITSRQEYQSEKIARPNHIIVYDFAAIPADVSADSAIAGQYTEHATPQTAEQIAASRKVGAEIAQVLVEDIRGNELPAERASAQLLAMQEKAPRLVLVWGRLWTLSTETPHVPTELSCLEK